jgi:predicted DNA-binding antitoxin AbrB/MazE fold protein
MSNFDLKKYLAEGRLYTEAIGDFNATNFSAAIKETLKKLGYQVKDITRDPANELEDAANAGKKEAIVGPVKFAEGEAVSVYVSVNQNDDTATQVKSKKELEEKIYNIYKNDFSTSMSNLKNGRVVNILIKDKAK